MILDPKMARTQKGSIFQLIW